MSGDMYSLFQLAIKHRASDLHLIANHPPHVRVNGRLIKLDSPPIRPSILKNLLYSILESQQIERLEKQLELSFSFAIPEMARFRGSILYQRSSLSAVFRIISHAIPSLDSLELPKVIKALCTLNRGLVLITGPAGSGKSTTLAAMIDYMNAHRRLNILTIEDPIEFSHTSNNSLISQREIGEDTHSFSGALRHGLRHDPDVILIGEIRDLDSMEIALTAAETGHLVLASLHTQSAPLTVTRIIDVFSNEKKTYIRQQLSNSLQAIVSQQLIPTIDNNHRVAAVELMINTPAVGNMIREAKEHQLYNVLQTGRAQGMQSMDQALAELYSLGKISMDKALDYCINKEEIRRMIVDHP